MQHSITDSLASNTHSANLAVTSYYLFGNFVQIVHVKLGLKCDEFRIKHIHSLVLHFVKYL